MASSLINNYFLIINLLSIVMYSVANPINGDIIDTDVFNLDQNKLNVNLNVPQVYISDDHRIQRCKEMHPTYDYDHLSEDDQSELSDKIDLNPCRVDCVIYENSMDSTGGMGHKRKVIYTEYFTDGKLLCDKRKVCKPKSGVGFCVDY